jgi:MSHA biogenesis protein MshN
VPATAEHGIRTGEPVVEKTSAESVAPSRAPAGQADALAAAMREARALAQRGEASAAMELLKQYSAAGGGNAEYHGLHAAVLQRLTLHAEAVDEYRAALRLAPSASVWWLGLGISLEALGRAREAREAFERARGGGLSAELAAFAEQRIGALR